ncbi:prefoldin subunit 5 [Oxalobacteraceae bacterium GrIS 1.11]
MQIAQSHSATGVASSGARVADEPAIAAGAAAAPADASPSPRSAPLQRGLSNWDHQLQGEISSAQQALDFLDQSSSQLQALKSELAAKLAEHQGRDGQVEARVRQFSNTWRTRQRASGGTLNAQLDYSSPEPSSQHFTIRGLTMANLQAGGKEVLAFSLAGSNQTLSSVNIDPGLSAGDIVQRFDQALAPLNIRVAAGADGALQFSTPEASWANVRDTLSVRGGGIRYPTGQMNRVQTDEQAQAIAPEAWSTADTDALRQTLQQVVQALAHVQQARNAVSQALAQASGRVATAQPSDLGVGMDSLAQRFIQTATAPGYESLQSITSALIGISRERVQSLLGLR